MSDDLNAFLNGKVEEEAAPAEVQETAPVETAAPEQPTEPTQEATQTTPETTEQPAPAGGRMVPLSALEAERSKRQEFERRLAELEKPKPAQQQPAAPQWINPAEDPAGYHNMMQERFLNERLNTSEMLTRREVGSEKVDAAVSEFQQAAQADPTLMQRLYAQPDPYAWLVKEVDAMKLRKEIGEDPAAYRARIRAEIEAEMAGQAQAAPVQQAPAAPPVPRMAPSLATARSAAPRSAPAFSGTPTVEDVFPVR